MRQLFLVIALIIPVSAAAQNLTGPAYAAAKKQELLQLQAHNAAARQVAAQPKRAKKAKAASTKSPTGPEYAAASQARVRSLQARNARSWGAAPVGPAYAAQVASYKANQRVWNGTWPNNSYFFSRPTVRIRPSIGSTPAFRGLSDPWMWHGQQPWGYWQWRY